MCTALRLAALLPALPLLYVAAVAAAAIACAPHGEGR